MTVVLVLMPIALAAMLALVYRWVLGEMRTLRLDIAAARKRIGEQSGDIFTLNNRAESARMTAHNTLDRASEMFASKGDVEALAEALGLERYYSPEEGGWRKKAK